MQEKEKAPEQVGGRQTPGGNGIGGGVCTLYFPVF